MDKESAQKKKRERAVNFTELEIRHLVDVAIKYSKIIENKQTDGAMWKEKDKAWAEIAVEFNAITGGIHRTAKVLRLKYDGIKRGLKQKQTKNKLEKKLLQFMTLSVHGLPAAGGNDSDIILPYSLTDSRKELLQLQTQIAEHEVLQKQEFADMQKKILLDRDQREQLQHDMIMKNLNLQQQLLLDTNERQQKEHDLHVQWMLLKIENEKADLLIKEKQLQ
ncbi:myb/sant-like dna-binding domain [Holotrichia oblita]|uniref:Myb/sant-like dna-binding domain n=1 Tax=Holotrichia oblita TaxID=644536 RepID=A0ACB9SKW5_HOLOL|nr:myb/sant-like dna-binding domain [Holotrichia oblita]